MKKTYRSLIDNLISENYLKTPEIIEAFKKIDRADFVLPEYKDFAYDNEPLPIGFGQTISQPSTVAFMIEKLQPKKGDKILEIGSGSGWQTAILAAITLKKNTIVALELIPEIAQLTIDNVSKYNFLKKGVVKIINANGKKGYQAEAPFDKIISGAAAFKTIPPAWREQLKIGGKIISPVDKSIFVIDKINENEFLQKEYEGFAFVPLVEG